MSVRVDRGKSSARSISTDRLIFGVGIPTHSLIANEFRLNFIMHLKLKVVTKLLYNDYS